MQTTMAGLVQVALQLQQLGEGAPALSHGPTATVATSSEVVPAEECPSSKQHPAHNPCIP